MGTIVERQRANGSTAFLAQVAVQRDGKTVRKNKTFGSRALANGWIKKQEKELTAPGEVERQVAAAEIKDVPKIKHAIKKAIDEGQGGRTKGYVLNTLLSLSVAEIDCDKVTSADLVAMCKDLRDERGIQPSTVGNYLSHMSEVFRIAEPAWNIPLDHTIIEKAKIAAEKLEYIGSANSRDRRPTLEELDKVLTYFEAQYRGEIEIAESVVREHGRTNVPMHKIIPFAIFSTRRQAEITRLRWDDLEEGESRVLVRQMKHPKKKKTNNVWVELPPEALRIALSMPREGEFIFPYRAGTVSSMFTAAIDVLEIDDLVFHDLRHEGVSRLFELGRTIPQAASVSGHTTWNSLKRYSHLKHKGDKYAGWPWLDVIAPRGEAA